MKKDNKKKTKKITFWSVLTKSIRDGVNKYKTEMKLQLKKHQLLSSKSDWSMIESFVQEMNTQPNLKITVRLNDGTEIQMRCYNEETMKDYEYIEAVVKE